MALTKLNFNDIMFSKDTALSCAMSTSLETPVAKNEVTRLVKEVLSMSTSTWLSTFGVTAKHFRLAKAVSLIDYYKAWVLIF